jgi:outer membrane usher protein
MAHRHWRIFLALAAGGSMMTHAAGAAGAGASLDTVATVVDDSLFAQVWINGIDSELIVQFHRDDARLSASGDDLRALGFERPAGAAPVALDAIPGVRYRLDVARQVVEIEADAAALQAVDLAPRPAMQPLSAAAWGGVLNYAGYADRAYGRLRGGATLEGRLFGPVGMVMNGAVVRDRRGGRGLAVRRLETRYVLDDPARMVRLTIGDHVATDGTGGGAVRAAGVQFSTRFSLQPDLVTAPMPRLAGGSGVPSTIDLFVDGVRQSSQTAGAGTYRVSQTPIVNGAGQVSMVVRDILGRETVQTLSFYGTTALLRPGLHAFSAQAGLLRKDAFGARDRYRDAFASGTWRRGMNDRLTLEARGVAARSIGQAGFSLNGKAGEFALFSVGADVARHRDGHGVQAVAAVRRDAGRMSFYVNVQKAFGDFRTIAARAGDPVTRMQAQIGGAFQSAALGSFSISATRFRTRAYDSRILAGNWSHQIGPRLMLFGNMVHSRYGRTETIATLGLTMPLGNRSTAAVQGVRDRNGLSGSASWSDAPPIEGGIGLRAALSGGANAPTRAIGGATLRGALGEMGFDAALTGRSSAVRAFGSGSAVWLGGGMPRLAGHVGESFALVETGHPNVGVQVENRFAGRTGRDGRLLVPDLPAQAPTKISVDMEDLGIAYDTVAGQAIVRPRDGTGTIVGLAVRQVRTATVRLVDERGAVLPLGSIVRRADGREDVVAYDGIVDLRDVDAEVKAEVRTPSGRCRIAFPPATAETVTCHGN